MKKITSFMVDHDTLQPGVYLSKVDGTVDTYDVRVKKPNGGDYMGYGAMHTIEHLFATYARSSFYHDKIVYVGPMGCRTGFYLLVRDMKHEDVVNLVRDTFVFIKNYDGDIPGKAKKECGNYLEHDLDAAKKIADEYTEVLKSCTKETIFYT